MLAILPDNGEQHLQAAQMVTPITIPIVQVLIQIQTHLQDHLHRQAALQAHPVQILLLSLFPMRLSIAAGL